MVRQRDAAKSDLEKKLAELTDKVESVKRAKRNLKEQVKTLESRGGRDSRAGKDASGKEDELRRKIDDIKKERDNARADVEALRRETDAKDKELRKLKDEKDDAARKVQEVERQREADQRAQELKSRNDDLNARLAALQASGPPKISTTAGADAELRSEVDRLKAELAKAQQSKRKDGNVSLALPRLASPRLACVLCRL